jgi:hypothetical protein
MKAKEKIKDIFSPKKSEGGVVIMLGKAKGKGKEMEDDEDEKCEKCGKKGCKMKCGGKIKMQDGGKVKKDKTISKEVIYKDPSIFGERGGYKYERATIERTSNGNIKIKENRKYPMGGIFNPFDDRGHKSNVETSMDTTGYSKGKRKTFTKHTSEERPGTFYGTDKTKKSEILSREDVSKELKKIKEKKEDSDYNKKYNSKELNEKVKGGIPYKTVETSKKSKGGKVSKMKMGGKTKKC